MDYSFYLFGDSGANYAACKVDMKQTSMFTQKY